jgi:hypothetical protein
MEKKKTTKAQYISRTLFLSCPIQWQRSVLLTVTVFAEHVTNNMTPEMRASLLLPAKLVKGEYDQNHLNIVLELYTIKKFVKKYAN